MSPTEQPGSAAGDVVLVTGAAGFTGRYVRAELEAAGFAVVGGVTSHPAQGDVVLDITSKADCRRVLDAVRPHYVIHLAALSFVHSPDPAEFYRVNVIGTTNLLEALVEENVAPRKVLVASSANVYGNRTAGTLDESAVPQPVNHYACSKLAMEHMAATWMERLPIVITRPFNYTGVGQAKQFVVPKIVTHFNERKPVIELGNLDVERDFSDVRDVARAYLALMKSELRDETVNICSGRAWALGAVIQHLEQLSGHHPQIRVNPAFVRATDVKTLIGSPQRLLRATGQTWAPTPFEDTLAWLYEHGESE